MIQSKAICLFKKCGRLKKSSFLFGLVCALFLISAIPDSAMCIDEKTVEHEVSQVLSFADFLFDEGDYYRAITEYKRYIYLSGVNKQLKNVDYAYFRIGLSYLAGEKYYDSEMSFKRIISDYSESSLIDDSVFYLGIIALQQDIGYLAEPRLKRLISDYPQSEYCDDAALAISIAKIKNGELDEAKKTINEAQKQCKSVNLQIYRDHINSAIDVFVNKQKKSKTIATWLSAILPGSGHFYCGRRWDGITSLSINSYFIYNTVKAYNHGKTGRGNTHLWFGLPFYVGNINGARTAAKRYNKKQKEDLLRELEMIVYEAGAQQ